MNVDDDDLIAAADMTSEDLHRELDVFVVRREPYWPDWLYRQYHSYRADCEIDADMFNRALAAVGRDNGPELLFQLHHAGALDIGYYPSVVADAWSMAEFPETHFDMPETWRDLFEQAGYTHDGQPAKRPTRPVTVYRGCHHDRRFGMSWTADLDRAQWFADRDLGHGTGQVYVFDAPPAALLAFIDASGRHEREYVLDPSPDYLNDNTVSEYSRDERA
jgi:hypothetical protein